jgi:hypothetical protein
VANSEREVSVRCKVLSWITQSLTVFVNLRCDTPQGVPANTRFTASYHRNIWPDMGAYLFATQEQTPSYTADPMFSYNSAGGTNTIVRNGAGSYTVTLGNMAWQTAEKGNPIVTAVGNNSDYCSIAQWVTSGSNIRVTVLCHTFNGALWDSKFLLSYSGSRVPAPFEWGAFAWANNPTAAAYTPSTLYSDTSSEDLSGISESSARPQAGKIAGGDWAHTS